MNSLASEDVDERFLWRKGPVLTNAKKGKQEGANILGTGSKTFLSFETNSVDRDRHRPQLETVHKVAKVHRYFSVSIS